MSDSPLHSVLNSPFECAIRSLFVLTSAWPDSVDLDRLTLLDHALIYGNEGSIGPSVSARAPIRSSGLGPRRANIRSGLELLTKANLIEVHKSDNGITYSAGDRAVPFLRLLETSHANALRQQAPIVWKHYTNFTDAQVSGEIRRLVNAEVEYSRQMERENGNANDL